MRTKSPSVPVPELNGTSHVTPQRTAQPALISPPRARRRPALIGFGVALIALSALGAAGVVKNLGHTQPVVVIAKDVPRGAVIGRGDLAIANLTPDSALRTVPGDQLAQAVGKRASSALASGSLLNPSSYTENLIPREGQSLVGASLKTGQLPAEALQVGDSVRVVQTPGQQGTASGGTTSKTPVSFTASVVSVQTNDDGAVVNLATDRDKAEPLVSLLSTGNAALILDSGER